MQTPCLISVDRYASQPPRYKGGTEAQRDPPDALRNDHPPAAPAVFDFLIVHFLIVRRGDSERSGDFEAVESSKPGPAFANAKQARIASCVSSYQISNGRRF